MSKSPVKILLADDHAIIRAGTRQILSLAFEAEFGEAADARETLECCHKYEWDILLLDISMPGRSGLDLLADLKACRPKMPVLVLSVHDEELFAARALRAGAAGYITKGTSPEELINAVRKILAGDRYVSERIVQMLMNALQKGQSGVPAHEALSAREFEVLTMIVAGQSGKQIAANLLISFKTVSTYRTRLLHKLGVSSNAQLVQYAISRGLVE